MMLESTDDEDPTQVNNQLWNYFRSRPNSTSQPHRRTDGKLAVA